MDRLLLKNQAKEEAHDETEKSVKNIPCPGHAHGGRFNAVALAVRNFGLLERLIILRVGVNIDVFPDGMTPEVLWGEEDHIASEDSLESVDIFDTTMKNGFAVGKAVIDMILNDNP